MTARTSCVVTVILGVTLAFTPAAAAQDEQFADLFRKGAESMRAARFDEAAAAFTECIRLQPEFAEAHFNLGLTRFEQNRFEDAVKAFDRSLELKPKLRGANLFLGIARYRINDFPRALTALRKEASLDAANPTVLMWLGVVQLAEGKASEAAADLDKAAKLKPDDIDILYHQGRAHMLMSREIYNRMFHADPNSWRVHEVLAAAFDQSDRLEDAIVECQEAIRLKPEEPGLHQQLGEIYWKQNHLDLAEAQFQDELRIDSHNLSSKYKLAVVSIERSKPGEAANLLKAVLQSYPNSVEAHYQLGRALAQVGDSESAAPHFAAVVAQPGKADPDILKQSYYQLAQAYRKLKRPEEAKAAMDNFVRLKKQADAQQQQTLGEKLNRARGGDSEPVTARDVRP